MVKALEWGGRSARLSSTTGRIPPRCSSAASHMPTGPPPTTTTSCGLNSFSCTLNAFAADETCLVVPITIQEICHPCARPASELDPRFSGDADRRAKGALRITEAERAADYRRGGEGILGDEVEGV